MNNTGKKHKHKPIVRILAIIAVGMMLLSPLLMLLNM